MSVFGHLEGESDVTEAGLIFWLSNNHIFQSQIRIMLLSKRNDLQNMNKPMAPYKSFDLKRFVILLE